MMRQHAGKIQAPKHTFILLIGDDVASSLVEELTMDFPYLGRCRLDSESCFWLSHCSKSSSIGKSTGCEGRDFSWS